MLTDDNAIIMALVVIVGSVITGMFKLLNSNTKAQNRMVDAQNRMTDAQKDLVRAHNKGNKEAEKRNGHIAEMVIDNRKAIQEGNKKVIQAVECLSKE